MSNLTPVADQMLEEVFSVEEIIKIFLLFWINNVRLVGGFIQKIKRNIH